MPSAQAAPTRPLGRRAPVALVVVLGSLAVAAAFVPSERVQWLPPVAGLLAVLAVAEGVMLQVRAGGLRGGPARDPLVLLGLGLCLTVASEVVRAAGTVSAARADAVALLAYPFLIAGLVRLTRTRLKEGALDTLLLAAIIPAVVLGFAWLPLSEAIAGWSHHDVRGGLQGSWQTGAFLVVDVLAVTIIARLAVTFRGKPVAYQLLVGASGCLLGAHVSRAVSGITGLVPAPLGSQTLLIVGFALFGAAALHPSIRRADARTRVVMLGRWHVTLLMLAVVAGPAYAVLRYGHRGGWVLIVAVAPAVVSLLVVGHLARMISERQRLEFSALHDALTGLPNRVHFHDRLALLVGRADDGLGVLFVDLDRFKDVNDTFGHDVGDDLLREVGRRLRDCVRDGDLVSRLSGDEFALLLCGGSDRDRARQVGERVLARFEEPFHIGPHALSVTPSIGVALFPEHGSDVEDLLRNADSAMYAAKAAGRNTVAVYRVGMQTHATQRLVVEDGVRAALDGRQFTLHYQPRLDALSGRIVGVEALVRWDHPAHGLIPPGAFLPAAEASGLVAPLGTWVLTAACRQAEEWRRIGFGDVPVSVNVSGQQFELQSVPAIVARALDESGLPPALLEVELIESVVMDRRVAVSSALAELDALGVGCSIDDFGTGYSNITDLYGYPISTVKLDGSVVATIGAESDAPVVRGAIALAHSLGLRVVAEGVESREQLDFLRAHGCDELQGFLVCPAVPARDMAALLERDRLLGATERWADLPWRPSGDQPGWDETRLQDTLMADAASAVDTEETEGRGARVVVLGTAGSFMVVPTLLGLGSAGGLPPQVQSHVTAALDAAGAVAPHPPLPVTRAAPGHRGQHQGHAVAAAGKTAVRHPSADPTAEPPTGLDGAASAPGLAPEPTAPAPTSLATPITSPVSVPSPRHGKAHANGLGPAAGQVKGPAKTKGNGATKVHGSGATKVHGSGATKVHGSGATKVHGSGATKVHGNGKSAGLATAAPAATATAPGRTPGKKSAPGKKAATRPGTPVASPPAAVATPVATDAAPVATGPVDHGQGKGNHGPGRG
jgi:diguanylate cyclase (GGDEF)-like protein